MRCLLIYDIPDDGKRTRIADVCLDYGLDRLQYSVFAGSLTRTLQDALMLKLTRTLGKRPGKLLLLPVCETDWDARSEKINSNPKDSAGGAPDTPQGDPDEHERANDAGGRAGRDAAAGDDARI
jgi:CRISPR-associated protein Cas2